MNVKWHHISPHFTTVSPLIDTTRNYKNYKNHTQGWYASLMILPTSHPGSAPSSVVCVSLLSWPGCKQGWPSPEMDSCLNAFNFMVRCKGFRVGLVPPSCLQFLLQMLGKRNHMTKLFSRCQNLSGRSGGLTDEFFLSLPEKNGTSCVNGGFDSQATIHLQGEGWDGCQYEWRI